MPITFQSSSTSSPPVYIWTAPDQSPFDISLRTWTWSYNKNLRAKDTFYGSPGKAPIFDYPNPRGYEPNWRRSWEWTFNRNLRGKDIFFGAPGQTHPYDWPNPRGVEPDPRRSWIQYSKISSYPTELRLSQQYVETVEAGTSNTLRLSQQYAEVVEAGTSNKVRLSQQYIEVVYSPTPKNRGHGHHTALPIPPPRSIDLYVHINYGGQKTLQLQDRIRGAPGQVVTYDWTVPPRTIWYRDWSQNLALTEAPAPFSQTDWKNPSRVTWYRDWAQNLILEEPGPKPFSQIDWPNPSRLTYTTQFGYADQLGTTLAPTTVVTVGELHNKPIFITMGYLGLIGSLGTTGSGPATPSNAYVTEDGVTFYVAEDGVTYYVQEA